MSKTAIIFRCELLPVSETFVASQAAALRKFQPIFAGIQRTRNSLPVPDGSVILMRNESISERVRRRIFLHTGWAPELCDQLRDRQPALIHAHFGPDGAVALPLASALQIPLVVTLHGYDVTLSEQRLKSGSYGRLYLKRRKRLEEAAARFICVSDFIRRKAIEAGFPESKLLVHYIGINQIFFVPGSRPRKHNLILFVGRLVEKKGCSYLIEAMELVRRKCPNATLAIIGDGPERSSLEALAKQKAVPCQFLGHQPAQIVRDWLGQCRVFCLPSVTAESGDTEGLPMVLAEAQSMGVPVVSTFHAGIPEVVCHEKTGLLAAERDCQGLANHLLLLLQDEVFWQACSERAISWVKGRFDLQSQTQKLEKIYEEAMEDNQARA